MDDSERFLVNSRFWIQRVLVPMAVFIGAGGNIISVIVLTRRRMRNSTNVYLTALAVADLVYLFFVLILSFEHYPNIHDPKYSLFWRFYGINHWFCDAASSTSVWLTVSFTIERYVAVCHPIRGKVLCTERRAKTIIWIISLLCFILTATTPLEYQLKLERICVNKMCKANNNSTIPLFELENFPNAPSASKDNNSYNNNYISKDLILNTAVNSQDNNTLFRQMQLDKLVYPTSIALNAKKCLENERVKYNKRNVLMNYTVNNEEANLSSSILDVSNEVFENDGRSNFSLDTVGNSTLQLNQMNDSCVECFPFTLKLMKENETCCLNSSYIDTETTSLGRNKIYQKVYYWFSSIVFGLLPLVMIATFNCFLINAVYKSQKQRKVMTNTQERMSQSQENRITLLLIGVVFLFLICQTPTSFFLIYDAFDETNDPYSRNIKKGLGNIFNFLCTLNASCNFILYCVLSDKFRRTFKLTFCSHSLSRQDTLITLTGGSRTTSQRFHSQRNLIKRETSEYPHRTPRNLEAQSLNSIPRSKSLLQRELGKAKTCDLHV